MQTPESVNKKNLKRFMKIISTPNRIVLDRMHSADAKVYSRLVGGDVNFYKRCIFILCSHFVAYLIWLRFGINGVKQSQSACYPSDAIDFWNRNPFDGNVIISLPALSIERSHKSTKWDFDRRILINTEHYGAAKAILFVIIISFDFFSLFIAQMR